MAGVVSKKRKSKGRATCNIYIIRLDPAVLKRRRFREANPQHDPRKPCVYVGLTAHSPKVRFEQHLRGYKCCKLVKDFGVALMPRHYERHNPMTRSEAEWMEREKARRLRNRGYAVWQK